MGTLIIVVEGKNFVVMGSESLSTLSYGENTPFNVGITRGIEKIKKISEHVAILLSGDADIGENIVQEFIRWRKNKPSRNIDGVTKVAKQLSNWCKENFINRYSGISLSEIPQIRFLVTGLNKRGIKFSQPCTYKLDSWRGFYPGISSVGFDSGGVSFLADYFLNRLYERNLSLGEIDKLLSLVAFVIKETIESGQAGVGGDIRLAYIDSDGFQQLPVEDAEYYLQQFPKFYGKKLFGGKE